MDQNSPQYQEAIKQGFTPDQINTYLQQKQPQQQQQPLPTQQPQFQSGSPAMTSQKPQDQSNPWDVRDWLPTIGAVGGGIVGGLIPGVDLTGVPEVAGAGVGGSLGEALKEKLKGEKMNAGNIALQGVMGGAGEGAGQLVGAGAKFLLGGVAAKAAGRAGDLLGNVTTAKLPQVLDKVIPDGLNYTDRLGQLSGTVDRAEALNLPPTQAITKLKTYGQDISNQLENLPEMNQTIDANKMLADFKQGLADRGITENDPRYAAAIKQSEDKILNLGTGSSEPSGLLGADGNPIPPRAGTATIKDVYGLKAQTANDDLQRVFTKLKSPLGADLTPEERVQLALWNATKNTMDEQGTPLIRHLNQEQNNVYDAGRAFAQAAGKANNTGAFRFSDILPLGLGHVLDGATGGIGGTAAAAAFEGAVHNPGAMGAVASGATKLAGAAPGISGAAGAAAGTGIGTMFSNGQPALGGAAGVGGIGANGTPLPLPANVKPNQYGGIDLPPLQANGVKGNVYPYESFLKDFVANSGDPQAQAQLKELYDANQDNVKSYINNNQLNGDEQQNMRDTYNLNYLMNTVRQQMASVPPSVLNRIKTVNDISALGGQYSQLATAMQMLRADLGKQLQGGVLRGYDISQLNVTPNMTDTPQAAAAKLDQVQTILAQRYMNLYGKYGLNTQTQPNQ